ncbi:MAG: TIGR02221 family CRISPR-associated protein [Deltaproteobacteria bacterium]|nr:TIGR02221 family CRISPR-associated protein [Deltaproteobacteria bacterium]
MANVYISFLGTNNYLECIYHCNGFETPEPVRFVQEASIQMNCSDWGPNDLILIFTTKEAERKNWVDDGHRNEKGEILPLKGLDRCLREMRLAAPHENRSIPEGYSEEEIWEIFRKVYDCLSPDDRVVFDITHAFRSIPLVAAIVLNYSKTLKNIQLKGIYYGAFEALGSIGQVKCMKVQDRRVRILDLTALDRLMDWTVATDRFLQSGDARMAGTLAKESVKEILKETRGRDEAARTIRDLGQSLECFTWMLSTCRGPEITETAMKLKRQVQLCRNLQLLPPFQPLFSTIDERLGAFRGENLQDGLAAVRWCLNHNLIQQGFTILQEILVTFVLEETGFDPLDRDKREKASHLFKVANDRLAGSPCKAEDPREPEGEDAQKILHVIQRYGALCQEVERMRTPRNDLNHAGFRPETERIRVDRSPGFAKKLGEILERVETLLNR